jgi:hypothetical protein
MGGHGLWKEIDCSLYFVVIAKVSYLPWVNYHQPHENTLIKKKDREKLHIPFLCGIMMHLYDYVICTKC